MAIALGIDTGGTYTDAVLIEYETDRVLATAKALTTKQDLTIGIRQAIDKVLAQQLGPICLVSLSTTLATNAIVEGKGAPICVLLIGYQGRIRNVDWNQALGTRHYAFIPGGHLVDGEEYQPLNLETARQAIEEHAPHVSAFAISGYFGTRNPAHELAVKQLVKSLTGLPVTCGHELTHRLDALRRAVTVALNARLIPLICELIEAVQQILQEKKISAPLMVVKGDGSLISASLAQQRPVETILSGPAASVVGARHLVGAQEAVIVDMGGTTTDIALIKEGKPRLSSQGAQVGNWHTMVEAINVHTIGLGGDSRIWLDRESELHVGPERVIPLSMLATWYPQVLETLAEAEETQPPHLTSEFLLLQKGNQLPKGEQPPFAKELFHTLETGPCSLLRVHQILKHPELYARYLQELERQGILIRAGFTPTDTAHVLGHYAAWDKRAAELGAERWAKVLRLDPHTFCQKIFRHTAQSIAREIVLALLKEEKLAPFGPVDSALLSLALAPQGNDSLLCSLTLQPRLIAIGAPACTYFPLVQELLHAKLAIPEHANVANAIGAVVGSIIFRVRILIVPLEGEGSFRVHLPDHIADFEDFNQALAYAEEQGREQARRGAMQAGAEEIQIQVHRDDQSAPVATGWGEELFLQTLLEITASGRPRLAHP